jgi:hypothetical protein
MGNTGPKTEAGKAAVAANLPHPVRHGLRSRLFMLTGTVPCNMLGCPEDFDTCERRVEGKPCPVLPDMERARIEAMIADLDPATLDPHTGDLLEPAGSHLPVTELDAIAEYVRLGTVVLVTSRYFDRIGLFRFRESEGLSMQGAFKHWAYCIALRDRLRDRWNWKKRHDTEPDLAVAILTASFRTGEPPCAPVPAIDGTCRVLPASGEDAPRVGARAGTEAACDEEAEPCA